MQPRHLSRLLCLNNQNLDQDNQTSQLIAQMIWYFLEGYKNRKQELNPNLSNCLKYTVAFEDGKHEIVFYKSKNSSLPK